MPRAPIRLPWIVVLVAAGGVSLTRPTPAAEKEDPWATLRGCIGILERFAGCSSDEKFAAFVERWKATQPAGEKATDKEIESRLHWWMRPPGRREQCAIWARRTGAPAHVGETSDLAKSAADKGISCEQIAGRIDKDGWIPTALVDARSD